MGSDHGLAFSKITLLAAVEAVVSGKQFVSTLANDNRPSKAQPYTAM